MVATFDPNLPTAKDRIRRLLGDADVANALRQDEDYVAAIALYPDEAEAAAFVAEGLAAEFARRPDSISDEGTSLRWGERVKTWLELAKRLTATAAGEAGVIVIERADAAEQSEYWRPYWYYPD